MHNDLGVYGVLQETKGARERFVLLQFRRCLRTWTCLSWKACPEVVELCQPTAKEVWKLLVSILVVLGQAATTLGFCLSRNAPRRSPGALPLELAMPLSQLWPGRPKSPASKVGAGGSLPHGPAAKSIVIAIRCVGAHANACGNCTPLRQRSSSES